MTVEELVLEAEKAFYERRNKDALIYLETALEINPNNIDIVLKLLRIYREMDQNDKVLEYSEKAYKIDKQNLEVLFERAYIYHGLGKYDEALLAYDEYLQIDPQNYYAILNKGLIYMHREQYDEALEYIDRAIAVKPQEVAGYLDKAKIYEQMNREQDAIKIYESLMITNPENIDVIIRKVNIYVKKEEYNEAIKIYDKMIEQDSENIILLSQRAEIKKLKGDLEEVINDYNIIINMENTTTNYYERFFDILYENNKFNEIEILLIDYKNRSEYKEEALNLEGKYSTWIGNFDRAKAVCESLINIDKDNLTYYFNYAYVLENLEEYDEALKILDSISDKEEEIDKVFNSKTRIMLMAKKYEQLRIMIKEKYEDNGDEIEYLDRMADLYKEEGKTLKSIKNYKKILQKTELEEYKIKANLEIAICYFKLKEFEESIKYYLIVDKLEGEDKAFIKRNIGLSYLQMKQNSKAVKYFSLAISLDVNYINARLNRAEAYTNMKKYKEAFEDYDYLIKELSEVTYYEEAHKILIKMKDYDKALEYLNKAKEFYYNDSSLFVDRANLYIILKDYEKALIELEHALSIKSYSEEILKLMINVLKKLGRTKEAEYYKMSI